jgi:uncharacterized protein YciI
LYFAIRTMDAEGSSALLEEATAAHLAYFARHRPRIFVAGSLLGNEREAIGTLYIIEADSLLGAIQFVEDGP